MDYSKIHHTTLISEYFRLFAEWKTLYNTKNKSDEENGKEDGIWQILEEIVEELKNRDFYLSADGTKFDYTDTSRIPTQDEIDFETEYEEVDIVDDYDDNSDDEWYGEY